MQQRTQRRASRLILLDHDGRVLLLRHSGLKGASFWAPPGGGVENGETFEQAALREASEELGLNHCSVRLLWEGVSEFVYIDRPVRQHECFFLLLGGLPGRRDGLQRVHEREGILEWRWWTVPELESTQETVFPDNLTAELRRIPSRHTDS